MSNDIFFSADYNNENFTGLFDRIINIKFTRKNGETFTLRSDYEPVWEGGRLSFKSCQPKPEIRVVYTQYQATMINVDIFVTNLNIIEFKENKTKANSLLSVKSGSTTNLPNDLLSRLGNPIVKAEIEMGYRGNFYNWAQERPSVFTQEQMYNAFLNLEIPSSVVDKKQLSSSQSFFKAQRRCEVTVEWAVHTSNPPDRVTQFHGYVGSTEAGFQPYASMSLDNMSAGEVGQITKSNIYESLNDTFDTIDSVTTQETIEGEKVKNKKGKWVVKRSTVSTRTTFRNFFNGGQPFTLLEGYCFHMLTRRFARSGIDVKRNSLLEQASLEYSLASVYPNSKQQLSEIRAEYAQKMYATERVFSPEYFVEEKGVIEYSSAVDSSYKKDLESIIDAQMIDTYIGSRYTVKNLPEQRKLYTAIRKVMAEAALNNTYLTWWDAADQINNSSQQGELPAAEVLFTEDIQSARKYIMSAENGEYNSQDCYFKGILSKDWILPVQNSSKDVILKNTVQKDVIFYPPTQIGGNGFVTSDQSTRRSVRCFSGLFEIRDAYLFGIPIMCSEKASKAFEKQQAGKSYVDFLFLQNPKAQVEWICKTWNFLYYSLHNGGFYIYDPSEDARETASQDFVTSQSSAPFRIPAVYDITLGPIRKIRMPFIAFLNPMSLIEWNSTAAIGEMISFYYQPEKGRNFFMVIKNEIDFSTTGDQNMMEIDLVDSQWKDKTEVPVAVLKQDNRKTFVDVIIIPDNQTDTWQKIYESPIGNIPAEMLGLWPETEDVQSKVLNSKVSPMQFFTLMKSWNPGLFLQSTEEETGWTWYDSLRRVDKKANKLYHPVSQDLKINFPDISYCLPLIADTTARRIFMKFPFMPSEADYTKMSEYDKAYILVYHNGAWTMELKEAVRASYKIIPV